MSRQATIQRKTRPEVNIKRLMRVLLVGLLAPVAAMAQPVHLYNPNGREVWAVGSMAAGAAGVPEGSSRIAVDARTRKQYAVELSGGLVSIGASLAPFEGMVLDIRPGTAEAGEAVSAVRQQDGSVRVENAFYGLLLDAAKGYTITKVTDRERNQELTASFGDLTLKRKTDRIVSDAISEAGFPDPGASAQSQAKVNCTIEQAGRSVARIVLSWSCPDGEVKEVITAYAASRVIEYDVYVKTGAALDYVTVGLKADGYGEKAIIMPDGERRSGRAPDTQRYRNAPCRVVGFDPDIGEALGLLTSPVTDGTVGLYLCGRPEGFADNAFGAQYYSRYLAYEPEGTEVTFALGLLVGGGKNVLENLAREVGDRFVLKPAGRVLVRSPGIALPCIAGDEISIQPVVERIPPDPGDQPSISLAIDGAAIGSSTVPPASPVFPWKPDAKGGAGKAEFKVGGQTFRYNVPVKKAAEIVKWWPDKLILPKGGRGTGTAIVKSNLNRPQQYSASLTRITGIDEQTAVWRKEVTLLAGEQKKIQIEWEAGARAYGRELRLSLLKDGRTVDKQSEYTTLGDDYTELVQLTVTNPGWFHLDGHQNWMIPIMREGYTGTMEYYSWAPDSQYDIAPTSETWEPHTDSQVSYRTEISGMFVKNMIDLAHQHGLKVVSWLNGFAGLSRAMEHPEELMYTKDGQPWIYNRKVYPEDGAEFVTIYRDYFSKERVLAWADKMGASVKMYGWDGVRFDCGFYPLIDAADPRFQTFQADELGTYTLDGRNRTELFEDPDAIGAEFADLWKARMREQDPAFRYHTNFPVDGEQQKLIPGYVAAISRGGGYLLQEQMIYTSLAYNSLQGWVEELRKNGENIRALGGQPAVGWMSFGPPGFSSLMHWTAFASGYHMFAWAGNRHDPVDSTWKEYRFALRYAEYFYAPNLQWLPIDQADIVVTPDQGVMWRNFVYRRELEGGITQYILSLLNLPEDSEKMYVNHPPASPKTNLQVTLNAASGRPVKVWVLAPEPEPHAVALDVVRQGGKPVVRIDELRQFAVAVFELTP